MRSFLILALLAFLSVPPLAVAEPMLCPDVSGGRFVLALDFSDISKPLQIAATLRNNTDKTYQRVVFDLILYNTEGQFLTLTRANVKNMPPKGEVPATVVVLSYLRPAERARRIGRCELDEVFAREPEQ